MASWLSALTRTRQAIRKGIGKLLGGGAALSEDDLEALEEALIGADLPVRLVGELVDELRDGSGDGNTVGGLLRAHAEAADVPARFDWVLKSRPYVILLVGVNGSGKTTTAAKLACLAKAQGLRPLLAATDTFRAAGADQLKIWAERVDCDVVAGVTGADAAAVAYDALDACISRGCDILIVDTAGRLHTSQPLMDELSKVRRALAKRLPDTPQETWIVLDASLGNNALSQAKLFHKSVPLTGAVVAKLDGSARAGFALAIEKDLNVPVQFTGIGEGMEDLVPFDREAFITALCAFEDGEAGRESPA